MTKYLDSLNLKKILFIGLFFRILATIFSKGYGFTDDHFEVVEIAQNHLDKLTNPFPFLAKGEIYLFNLIYPAFHYIIFAICESLGIYNPDVKMFWVRLAHALFSMLTIYYGYLLTERLSKRPNDAKIVGLLLATFWVFPFMSVRNLREFACIPPLFMACYYAVDKNLGTKQILLAAWWFTIAFVFRYQIIFIPFVIGLTWLLSKQNWQKAVIFGLAFGIFFALTQGLFDYLYWGSPIASLQAYSDYNSN
ncbi:MAG: mannosyltransferase, partial [Bacteroidota bacterium]